MRFRSRRSRADHGERVRPLRVRTLLRLPPRQAKPLALASAPAAVLFGTVLQYLLLPEPSVAPFLFFFPCIAFASWVAGRGPGLLAVLLSALLGNFLFIEPFGAWSFEAPALVTTALFIGASAVVALLCASFRAAFLEVDRLSMQQVRADEALRKKEATLAQAGQMAHLGAWELEVSNPGDVAAGRPTWSDEVYRIFGLEPGTVTITNGLFFERVHPDDRSRIAQVVAEAIAEKRPYSIVHRIVRPDGTERVVQEHAELVFDEQGVLIRMLGAVQDITERRLAEEALRASEQRLKRAQEIAHLGSWELDVVTNRLTWSDEVYRIVGLEPQEFAATYEAFLEAVHPEDRAAVDAAYSGSLREGKDSYEIEHRVVRKATGEVRIVHEKCDHLRGPSGQIVRSIGMVHDITERKLAEEALHEANARLTEADERKNEFLAMLSHELRNPLAPIKNSLYILDRAVSGGDQALRAKAVIDRQIGQLVRLVDDLLDVTRITRNKLQLQRQRLELNELVRRTMDDQRSLFDKNEVALELTPAQAPVYVSADWTRLAQVIGNLLQNAAKFAGRKGVTRVGVTTDPGQRSAIIRVEDTGVGMEPELLSRLFEPFAQADQTLDRSKGGLGLGLALVKGLVELHGGDVSARSEGLGRGSEFVVRLPLDLPEKAKPLVARSRAERSRRRVLVIEDNVDAADSLREALEFEDHEVAVAYNGPDGLKKAREFRPHVVLCDIGLPGIDGYQVASAIRSDEAIRGVFLVALSGYAMPEDIQRASDAGFDRHLAKPPSLEQLEELLASAGEAKG